MSNFIDNQVEKVKREINAEVTFQNLMQYVKSLGISVFYYSQGEEVIKQNDLELEALVNESFIYNDKEDTTKAIFIKDEAENKLFLLAHELGHYIFSHGPGKTSEEEYIANDFARLLLGITTDKEEIKRKKVHKKVIVVLGTLVLVSFTLSYYLGNNVPTQQQEQIINSVPAVTEQPEPDVPANTTEQTYVLTRTGDKYHLPSCYYVRDKNDLVEITLEEAEKGGYEPCKVCIGE